MVTNLTHEGVINRACELWDFHRRKRQTLWTKLEKAVHPDGEGFEWKPNRVPDGLKILTFRKIIVWLEVDEWHATKDDKLETLAWWNDYLLGYDWGLTLIVVKINPIPVMMVWNWKHFLPNVWKKNPKLLVMPRALYNE